MKQYSDEESDVEGPKMYPAQSSENQKLFCVCARCGGGGGGGGRRLTKIKDAQKHFGFGFFKLRKKL